MEKYRCPICLEFFSLANRQLQCVHGHSFDCAKQGYVNLLQTQSQKQHGDDGVMVASRRDFFEAGYYSIFRDQLLALVAQYQPSAVLDAGCGEGWYTSAVSECVDVVYGIDISKQAIIAAAKRRCGISLAVASTYHLPVHNESFDMVYAVFAPFDAGEVLRVLCSGGIFIHVFPLEKHLMEMKAVLYDKPYDNEVVIASYSGLKLLGVERVEGRIDVVGQSHIQHLFSMTPYYHRTPEAGKQALATYKHLETQIGFGFAIYQKEV